MKEIVQLILNDKISQLSAFFESPEAQKIWRTQSVSEAIWFALIDICSKKAIQGDPQRAWRWLDLVVNKAKFPINERSIKGEYPVFMVLEKNELIAHWLLEKADLNPQMKNRMGQTVEELLVKKIKDKSVELLRASEKKARLSGLSQQTESLIQWIEKKGKVESSGAELLFPLFLSFSIYPQYIEKTDEAEAAMMYQEALHVRQRCIKKMLDTGKDINQPQLCRDLENAVQINTPLAYMIKKLDEVNQRMGSYPMLNKEFLSEWVDFLLDCGADPCLQLEKTHQVYLMEIVRSWGAQSGLAEFIEKKILLQAIEAGSSGSPMKEVPRKRL